MKRAEQETGGDHVIINEHVRVVQPDMESTSGVVHIIDDVLQCPCVPEFQTWRRGG